MSAQRGVLAVMDTTAIKQSADALDAARARLAKAQGDLAKLRGLGGTHGYAVSVNGVQIAVSVMDGRYYTPKLVRGREMIHLGALKALTGVVDECAARVTECEANLARAARMDPQPGEQA